MKRCSKCNEYKSFENYYKRGMGPRSGQFYERCKDCYKTRGREYYNQNREKQLALSLIRKQRYIRERKQFLERLKLKPCLDCKKIYPPWVMDFDHRDGSSKMGNISKLTLRKFWSMNRIEEEIEKCDLVCANCHRMRTHNRLQL